MVIAIMSVKMMYQLIVHIGSVMHVLIVMNIEKNRGFQMLSVEKGRRDYARMLGK